MKSYIFYTSEGITISPNGNVVENLQILGFENGLNINEALCQFFYKNKWIYKTGYSKEKVICKEIYSVY